MKKCLLRTWQYSCFHRKHFLWGCTVGYSFRKKYFPTRALWTVFPQTSFWKGSLVQASAMWFHPSISERILFQKIFCICFKSFHIFSHIICLHIYLIIAHQKDLAMSHHLNKPTHHHSISPQPTHLVIPRYLNHPPITHQSHPTPITNHLPQQVPSTHYQKSMPCFPGTLSKKNWLPSFDKCCFSSSNHSQQYRRSE